MIVLAPRRCRLQLTWRSACGVCSRLCVRCDTALHPSRCIPGRCSTDTAPGRAGAPSSHVTRVARGGECCDVLEQTVGCLVVCLLSAAGAGAALSQPSLLCGLAHRMLTTWALLLASRLVCSAGTPSSVSRTVLLPEFCGGPRLLDSCPASARRRCAGRVRGAAVSPSASCGRHLGACLRSWFGRTRRTRRAADHGAAAERRRAR